MATSIFSDDLATSVRDSWRDLIADGVTPDEATDRILSEQRGSLGDPDRRSIVWLALAVSQWTTGRVVDRVRDAALTVIDDGSDLARWAPGPQRDARSKALEKARTQLVAPPPAAKKLRKRSVASTPFLPGDVIGYSHASGLRFVLWVSHNQTDRGGTYSDAEVLDPYGPPVDVGSLAGYPGTEFRYHPGEAMTHRLGFVLLGASRIPASRYEVLANARRPASRPRYDPVVIRAGELDDWLRPFLPGGDRILRHPANR